MDEVTVYVITGSLTNYGDIVICTGGGLLDLNENVNYPGGEFTIVINTINQPITDGLLNPSALASDTYIVNYTIQNGTYSESTNFQVQVLDYSAATVTHPNGLNASTGTTILTGNLQFLED